MINPKGITKQSILAGIIVGFWICITFVVLGAVGVKDAWPAFMVLILFFLANADPKSLMSIIPGGIFGLLVAQASTPLIVSIASVVGNEKLATLIGVFVILAVLLSLKDFIPIIFNNYALLYWTIALAFLPTLHTLTWSLTALLGGAFAVGGLLLIFRLLGVGHKEEHEESA